jgi:acetyl/propionyl-CoA carboxylase alpha subunit
LPKTQEQIHARGHALECRIYAEDPAQNFLPSSGKVLILEEPHIPGVRIDSGIRTGSDVSVYYDPILSKVITVADTREHAIEKMQGALDNYVILGVATPIELLRDVLHHPEFHKGNLSTHFLDDYLPNWKPGAPSEHEFAAALYAATRAQTQMTASAANGANAGIPSPWESLGAWQIANAEASR